MIPFSIILTLIHIENISADKETLFRKTTNTTGWKLYEVLHGSHFLQCGVWCSQSDRCHSFSMDPALLTCHLFGNDRVDNQRPITEPRDLTAWEKVMSFKNKPDTPKVDPETIRSQCVNGVKNVALKKTTNQSSTYGEYCESYRAVDGNRNTDYMRGKSCSHTNSHSKEWWSVDLEVVYDIKDIKIWNRMDCCSNRLSDFTVYVGNRSLADRSINYKTCLYHPGWFKDMKTLSCDQWSSGQFLKIELFNGKHLALCEVEVYPRLCDTD